MPYTIITHDGKAHMDELLASGLLALALKELPLEVMRIDAEDAAELVRNRLYKKNTWFIDCGLEYNPEEMKFDHHQDGDMDSAALLVFDHFFPELRGTELHEYVSLISRVDTKGPRSLDDFEHISESRTYWSFTQSLWLRNFEENPIEIIELFSKGLADRIQFEQDKKEASLWLKTPGNVELVTIENIKVLRYREMPPVKLKSPIKSAQADLIDEEGISVTYGFDYKNPDNRVLFRSNFGHDHVDFNKSCPVSVSFCHKGGFLLKFTPENENEWLKLIAEALVE